MNASNPAPLHAGLINTAATRLARNRGGKPSKHMTFTLSLNQPRTLCLDDAAYDRFTQLTGKNPGQLETLSSGPAIEGIRLLATLIWCALPTVDRESTSHGAISELLTQSMIQEFAKNAHAAQWQAADRN